MEARLRSRAAKMLIAIATVLPRVCAGEAQRNTSSVACARAVVLHVQLYDHSWLEHHLCTAGRSLVARTNGGLSDHVTKPWSRADRITLIKAQVVRLAAERGTWDETEATHQRVHNQRRRLEAAHCDAISISICDGRRRRHHTASLTLAPQCYAFA